MKERIKNLLENLDKGKVLAEQKKWKTMYKKLTQAYDVLYLDNIATENEMMLLKQENKILQQQKREIVNAFKYQKEELRRTKMMLMQDGTTLKDIKNALGVK